MTKGLKHVSTKVYVFEVISAIKKVIKIMIIIKLKEKGIMKRKGAENRDRKSY